MSFTELGPFVGPRAPKFIPYAERQRYAGKGRHYVKPTRSPLRWLRSALREVGDFIAVAWRPIAQAV